MASLETYYTAALPVVRLLLVLLVSMLLFGMALIIEDGERDAFQHRRRFVLALVLALVASPWTWALLPAWLAIAGAGYLFYDPAVDVNAPVPTTASRWLSFWQNLTGRREDTALWSAYVEAVLLLASIGWFAYLAQS